MDSHTHRNLRALLRNRDVYVPKRQNVLIADALYRVVQEEIPWPDEDSEKPVQTKIQASPQVIAIKDAATEMIN